MPPTPHHVLEAPRARERVPGLVIGMQSLRLKGQEQGAPAVQGGVVNQKRTVLPDAVVADEAAGVALVHVDVVDAVAGREAEHLVALALRAATFTERVNHRVRVGDRPLQLARQQVAEVVVHAEQIVRQGDHLLEVEGVAANEIDTAAARPPGQGVKAGREGGKLLGQRMQEGGRREVHQLRGLEAGLDVDREAKARCAGIEVDLIVRGCRRRSRGDGPEAGP